MIGEPAGLLAFVEILFPLKNCLGQRKLVPGDFLVPMQLIYKMVLTDGRIFRIIINRNRYYLEKVTDF